jgi:hypothetical protein
MTPLPPLQPSISVAAGPNVNQLATPSSSALPSSAAKQYMTTVFNYFWDQHHPPLFYLMLLSDLLLYAPSNVTKM